MKSTAFIQSIYIAHAAGAPMQQMLQAQLIAGSGIGGDRYAQGVGAFSNTTPTKIRHITLITRSGIAFANQLLKSKQYSQFSEAQTRRNIIISGMPSEALNDLVGQVFYLGRLGLRGVELCEPCQRPAKLLQKMDFLESFNGQGGIRVEVLDSGILLPGDTLSI